MAKRTVYLGQGMVRPGCYAEGGTVVVDDPLQRQHAIDDERYRAPDSHIHSALPTMWASEVLAAAEARVRLTQQIRSGSMSVDRAALEWRSYRLISPPCNICTKCEPHTHWETAGGGW